MGKKFDRKKSRLRQLRKVLGLTQEELSDKLGGRYCSTYISRLEGKELVPIELAKLIKDIFEEVSEVDYMWLIGSIDDISDNELWLYSCGDDSINNGLTDLDAELKKMGAEKMERQKKELMADAWEKEWEQIKSKNQAIIEKWHTMCAMIWNQHSRIKGQDAAIEIQNKHIERLEKITLPK